MPRAKAGPGHVYLFRLGEFVKIGSSGNVENRLRAYATLPYPSELLHAISSTNAQQIEKTLHRRFAKDRVKGEWFRLTEEDVSRLKLLSTVDSADDLPSDLHVSRSSRASTHPLYLQRQRAGLSQAQLAEKANVPIGTLRNWEQDRRIPRLDTAMRVAVALGVALDNLVDRPATESATDTSPSLM